MFEKLDSLIGIVRQCGQTVLSAHNVEQENNAVDVKAGTANFVTKYDKAVQSQLIDGISQLFPEAVFFAEEKDNSHENFFSDLLFIIDPIDGTTNFIHDMRCSAISVGVFSKGKPICGVVFNPYTDEMFTASADDGAFCNGKRIKVSQRPLSQALISFGTVPYEREQYADIVFDKAKKLFLNCADIRRSGSAAYDMCCVASGKTDAFFEERLSPWDYAAGSIIVTEAGGICSASDGTELMFGSCSSCLCSNPVIYDDFLRITLT